MTNPVLLNNVDHQNLRVIVGHGPEFGDNINQALIFPTEFEEIQREYPIFFRQDANGEFQTVALLGLEKGENLFLDEHGWQARYVPAIQARGPFLIGLQKREGEDDREPIIQVDLDHPRISKTDDGYPVFLPQGGNSPYLDHIALVLRMIHQGHALAKPMFDAFQELDIIEPITVEMQLSDREKCTALDFFSISEEKFAALDGPALEQLHRAGFLHMAFMVRSSLRNVSRLLDMKNRKRAAQT